MGGKFVYCMRGAGLDGVVKDWWNTRKHLEIAPMKKTVTSMSFADEHSNPVPASHYGMSGEWPMETILTVTSEDVEGVKTKITLRESGIPNEMMELSRLAWNNHWTNSPSR